MKNTFLQKMIITVILTFLCITAFQIRLQNFRNSILRSIDEFTFVHMAKQVVQDISAYNTIEYGKKLAKERKLHDYYYAPLFKHPPVFTYTAALFMKIFGVKAISAGYVSIFLSVLMMPLVYWLGRLVFNKKVGLLAAILLWFDPISIMTSQKVWMDTMIAFFTLLAAVLFVYALKKNNDWFFIFSGIASGLATNTKYTGILITFAIILYATVYRRDLFKNRSFIFSLALPALLTVPWLLWNLQVYGLQDIFQNKELRRALWIFSRARWYLITLTLALIGFLLLKERRKKHSGKLPDIQNPGETASAPDKILSMSRQNTWIRFSQVAIVFFLLIFFRTSLLSTFNLFHIPETTWKQGVFANESRTFYFRRLLEYFPVYLFAYLAFFTHFSQKQSYTSFLRITTILILLFFIAWGNYQCRYILPIVPFLLVLAAGKMEQLLERINAIQKSFPRILFLTIFITIIVYSVMKVSYLNHALSYTNDMCYF